MSATDASAIDISKRDLTLDIARVFCVLLVVVIHLLGSVWGGMPREPW